MKELKITISRSIYLKGDCMEFIYGCKTARPRNMLMSIPTLYIWQENKWRENWDTKLRMYRKSSTVRSLGCRKPNTRKVFTVVVLVLDIVFQLLLVIALAKWLMQTVFDFIYNQRILVFISYSVMHAN